MPPQELAAQIIARLYERFGYDPDKITIELFSELKVDGRAKRVLYPLVRDRVQHVASRYARSQSVTDGHNRPDSRAADRARQREQGTAKSQSQRRQPRKITDPRLRFMNCEVIIPTGSKLYGDFTVEDHQARVKIHAANLIGAASRISGHQWAMGEIQKVKVTTLREIAEGQLIADLPEKGIMV
jgi:hypothetical protein